VNFEAQLQGGVIFGLGHRENCELNLSRRRGAEQDNYHNCTRAMRLGIKDPADYGARA